MKPRALLVALAALLWAAPRSPADDSRPAYLDPAQPQEQRIHDLLSRMTLEEKASMMENTTPGVPRLGIPKYNWWSEALHGVANAGVATVFPQAIGLAAMWDAPLHGQIAHVIGIEARAKFNGYAGQPVQGTLFHGLTFWSPNINIFRDPRWGRGQETYGEDPFLTSRLGVAFVRGLQGDDPTYLQAAACAKHFAVHSGPESMRHILDVSPPEADLYETYLPAFEALVREGHVEAVMTAYNSLYGTPCSINPLLYGQLAKWGFNGHITSDCGSVEDLIHSYHRAADPAEAAALTLRAGLNVRCGFEPGGIVAAEQRGLISGREIDQRLAPLLRTMFRLGFFDPKDRIPFNRIAPTQNDTPEHAALALRAARESIVLLKNDGTLPLDAGRLKRIAVIGPNATSVSALVGNYNGTPSAPVTVLDGLRAVLGAAVTLTYAHGCDYADLKAGERPMAGGWYHGQYFANRELAGEPAALRSDRPIRLNPSSSPAGRELPVGVPDHGISVRWTGDILTTLAGDYRFIVHCRGGVRLLVGGKAILEDWAPPASEAGDERTFAVLAPLPENASIPFTLEYVQGNGPADISLDWNTPATDGGLAEAMAVARDADAVLFVGGLSAQLEGEEMEVPYEGFSGGDRTRIELPALQERLLRQIASLHKPLILVCLSGSAVAMPWEAEHANAVVQSFYPGEAGGRAVADVLLGRYNPAGRLPVTFYRTTQDLPSFTDYRMANRTYRYFSGTPLYPFGFGLSYTRFSYRALRATPVPGGAMAVAIEVTNAGDHDGDEVVQLYATPPAASHPREREALCGFRRVHLAKGETRTVNIVVPPFALRRWSSAGKDYFIPTGEWTLRAGGSSADLPVGAAVRL